MKNIKNIIREVSPEAMDAQYYFDDSYINGDCGEECMIYIVYSDWGRISGFNTEKYQNWINVAENIADGFSEIGGRYATYSSYKECMTDYGLPYSPKKCHDLKEWCKADSYNYDSMAAFLTIATGKEWSVKEVRGYCQGDFVAVIYCKDYHTEKSARIYGEVYLGCCKEFCVIDLDENGEEEDAVYGYIVADCEAWNDEDYKKIVCDWACIDPEETQLEMISGYHTITTCDYRIA